jgi:TonB family protein
MTASREVLCYSGRMKKHLLAATAFFACPLLFAQTDSARTLPTDPKALLDMATPYYDYASADMKPWHIRYHYRYYDRTGAQSAEGEFDYWWSTSKVSKAAWTQGNQAHVEWHTADGKDLRSITGNDIPSLAQGLYSSLLPSFWTMKDAPPSDGQLKYFTSKYSSKKVACVASVRPSSIEVKDEPFDNLWPAYCFDQHEPVLIASREHGTITNSYDQVRQFQNHNFPVQIEIDYAGYKCLQATLEDLREVQADDVAFTPSPDAKERVLQTRVTTAPLITMQPIVLVQRVAPVYPQMARAAHITGTVVLSATIGKDGRIKDAKIVSSPDASLSAAALDAVRQWRYEPYKVNGQATEIHTTINLAFTL